MDTTLIRTSSAGDILGIRARGTRVSSPC